MKLYFYIFGYRELSFYECEVEEKSKSYTLIGKVPGFYKNRVLKSEIGFMAGYNEQIVILVKRDDELAKGYFSNYLNEEIHKLQKKIIKLTGKLKYVSEWEAENLQEN